MPEVYVYPTVATEDPADPWVNPDNACDPHDGNCANKSKAAGFTLPLSGFDFSGIPDDAVLDEVCINLHGKLTNAFSPASRLSVQMQYGGWTIGGGDIAPTGGAPSCAASADGIEQEVYVGFFDLLGFCVDDLHTENFTFWIEDTYGGAGSDVVNVDCAWIRVSYHVPVAAGHKKLRMGLG